MSQAERDRLVVLSQVKAGRITLAEAAPLMALSYRQAKRVWARWHREGDAGVIHRARGRPGNAAGRADTRRQAGVRAYRDRYAGFGPTLAAEQMAAREGLVVDHETLRRWLVAAGLWKPRRDRRREHRRWRPRRAHAGEMVQMDGSDHDWFEGRGPRCTLMVMIDDATGWTYAQFHDAESTRSAMLTLWGYARARGLPRAIYLDRCSAYRVNGRAADEAEGRGGKRPPTQFGRAAAELGVELIHAHSPQAKGRVERANGTLQDRLVKLLRIEGIGDLAAANAYLREAFLPAHNARFGVEPAEAADLHRPAGEAQLEAALCLRETRVVGNDYCLSYRGRWLQLLGHDANLGLRGREVTLVEHLDGRLEPRAGGRTLRHELLPGRPVAPPRPGPAARERVASHRPRRPPAADHPFRARIVEARRGDAAAGAAAAPATAKGTVLVSP